MLHNHKNKDFSEVKLGMFVLQYLRKAFDCQISEAVKIEQESRTSGILNSMSEWNQCPLPRLMKRIGNSENELKDLEIEMLEKKKTEEGIENKIRGIR